MRSKQRDKDDGSSGRTLNRPEDSKIEIIKGPYLCYLFIVENNKYYDVGKVPKTVKHSTSKSLKFKPPLPPQHHQSITGCTRYLVYSLILIGIEGIAM